MRAGSRQLGWVLLVGMLPGCTSDTPRAKDTVVVAAQPAPPPKARLMQLSGTVNVKRAAGDDWIRAAEKMDLFQNDKVRTATGASALVEFANGSSITLGEDALIAIAETRARQTEEPTHVTVLKGKVGAELKDANKKSLSVSTPAVTIRAGREVVFQ